MDTKLYSIREATPVDESNIRLLFKEMLQAIYHKEDVEDYPFGYLDKFWHNTKDIIYVAETNNQVIAYLSIEYHQEENEYLYLDDFSVTDSYRGIGIGTNLIYKAEEYAKSLNIHTVLLHVEKDNKQAYNFYKRLGYEIYKDEDNRLLLKKDIYEY